MASARCSSLTWASPLAQIVIVLAVYARVQEGIRMMPSVKVRRATSLTRVSRALSNLPPYLQHSPCQRAGAGTAPPARPVGRRGGADAAAWAGAYQQGTGPASAHQPQDAPGCRERR